MQRLVQWCSFANTIEEPSDIQIRAAAGTPRTVTRMMSNAATFAFVLYAIMILAAIVLTVVIVVLVIRALRLQIQLLKLRIKSYDAGAPTDPEKAHDSKA